LERAAMKILCVLLFIWGSSILILIAALWASNRRHEKRLDAMRAEAERRRDEAYSAARARFLP
jgi:hypothetical protein